MPVFPSAGQYSGTTEVFTQQRPSRSSPAPTNMSAARSHQQIDRPPSRPNDPRYDPQLSSNRRPPERPTQAPVGGTRIPPHHLNTTPQYRQPESYRPPQDPRRDQQPRTPVNEMRQVSLGSNHSHESYSSGPAPQRRPVMGVQSNSDRRVPYSPPNTNFVGQPFGVVVSQSHHRPADYDPVLWNIFCQVREIRSVHMITLLIS